MRSISGLEPRHGPFPRRRQARGSGHMRMTSMLDGPVESNRKSLPVSVENALPSVTGRVNADAVLCCVGEAMSFSSSLWWRSSTVEREYLSPAGTERAGVGSYTSRMRFADAASYAASLHATQVRKGSRIPYISHPFAVASIVLEHGGDEDQAIAGLLHDGPEDCGGQPVLDEIERRYGSRVARLVAALSDTMEDPKPPWRQRKEAYISHLRAEVGDDVMVVSMADKLHNARSIVRDHAEVGEALWQRFTGRKEGTLWYYASLVQVFEERNAQPKSLRDELARTVARMG